ncbi:MAG: hypothetical protein K940chlam9_01705, partial [Chlamydiae bacterium]|nr:hypothetical protein [Chlamydiota bacterium]
MICSGIGGSQGPDCIKGLAETPKTQSLILLVGATITVLGILLVSLTPMAPNVAGTTTMKVFGELFLFVGTPIVSIGIMLMIFSKCVLDKPWKEYFPEISCSCPSPPQGSP